MAGGRHEKPLHERIRFLEVALECEWARYRRFDQFSWYVRVEREKSYAHCDQLLVDLLKLYDERVLVAQAEPA